MLAELGIGVLAALLLEVTAVCSSGALAAGHEITSWGTCRTPMRIAAVGRLHRLALLTGEQRWPQGRRRHRSRLGPALEGTTVADDLSAACLAGRVRPERRPAVR